MKKEITNQELLEVLHSTAEVKRLESDHLKLQAESLLRQEHELHIERKTIKEVIALIEGARSEVGEPEEETEETANNAETNLSDLTVHFDGAQNHAERVHRIAVAAHGSGRLLNTSAVTRYLLETGQAQSTVNNLRPTVHKIFEEQPEQYRKVSPGHFQYIGTDNNSHSEPPTTDTPLDSLEKD